MRDDRRPPPQIPTWARTPDDWHARALAAVRVQRRRLLPRGLVELTRNEATTGGAFSTGAGAPPSTPGTPEPGDGAAAESTDASTPRGWPAVSYPAGGPPAGGGGPRVFQTPLPNPNPGGPSVSSVTHGSAAAAASPFAASIALKGLRGPRPAWAFAPGISAATAAALAVDAGKRGGVAGVRGLGAKRPAWGFTPASAAPTAAAFPTVGMKGWGPRNPFAW